MELRTCYNEDVFPVQVYQAAIQLIPARDGWKHLPRIWSDLLASNFNKARLNDKFKLFGVLVDTMNQSDLMEPAVRADGEDHAMFQHFVSINQAMVDLFLKDADLSRAKSDW